MLHFIMCDYHGCEEQHRRQLKPNQPLNLALVETYTKEGSRSIKFLFQRNEPILWNFINDALRDLELQRINDEVMQMRSNDY